VRVAAFGEDGAAVGGEDDGVAVDITVREAGGVQRGQRLSNVDAYEQCHRCGDGDAGGEERAERGRGGNVGDEPQIPAVVHLIDQHLEPGHRAHGPHNRTQAVGDRLVELGGVEP
jgi:hypothetical protein